MALVAIPKRTKMLGLFVEEIIVIVLSIVAVICYSYFGLSLRAPLSLYFQRITGTLPCYAVSLCLALFMVRLRHLSEGRRIRQIVPHEFTWRKFKSVFLTRASVERDLRLLNAICLMFVVFVNLKHLIPYINPHFFDWGFIGIEEKIFHGRLLGEIFIDKFGVGIAPFFSEIYKLFYAYVAAVLYIIILQRDEQLTHQYLVAFILTWFLGLAVVYLLPTQGPIFFSPERFGLLPSTGVTDMQFRLWQHWQLLQNEPQHPSAIYLISAMPSLHFAIPILGSIYLRRVHWSLALFSWIFVALTFITTQYFGWHYLIDDLAAIVLVRVIYLVVQRLFRPHIYRVPDEKVPIRA